MSSESCLSSMGKERDRLDDRSQSGKKEKIGRYRTRGDNRKVQVMTFCSRLVSPTLFCPQAKGEDTDGPTGPEFTVEAPKHRVRERRNDKTVTPVF